LSFALELKESFPTDRVDMFIAKDADHSDSSHTPGYREAIRSFLDRYGSA
jgi:hypothetical protein